MELILGLIMIYATIHLLMLQHVRTWDKRSVYEKVVTIVGIISIALVYLSIMS